MPTITYTLDDGFGTPGKKMKLRWRPTSPQGVSGAVIVAPGAPQWVSSVVGTPTTVTGIAATRWEIDNLGHINNHQPIYIDVPAEGGDVTALIRAAIGVPAEAPVSTLVAAAKDAAEVAVAGLDVLTQEDLEAGLPAAISAALAEDETVAGAAAAAVGDALSEADLLQALESAGSADDAAVVFTDADGNRGWLEWNASGGLTNLAKLLICAAIGFWRGPTEPAFPCVWFKTDPTTGELLDILDVTA